MSNVTQHHVFQQDRLAFLCEGPVMPDRCGLVWLCGFKSQMTGEKASRLARWATAQQRNLLRFDYSGHGQSTGEFTDGTISLWLDQAVEMFCHHTPGPRVVIGSSMGAWIALLLVRRLRTQAPDAAARIRGLVLLAPAVDMTATLIPQGMTAAEKESLERTGIAERSSAYGDGPYQITRQLLEDGERHLLFGEPFPVDFPVRILHGDADPDVPVQHGLKVFGMLEGSDVTFTLIKGGDHRLSDPVNLVLLEETVAALCARGDGSV